jgi:type I restriction enzyme S subunit
MTDYLELAFQSPLVQEQMIGVGSGLQHIHLTDLKRDLIPITPEQERAEIVKRVQVAFTWVDRLAHEATSGRKLIDHLDQAVLAKAFRGELVSQDPNDEPASALLERIKVERVARPSALGPIKASLHYTTG